QMRGNRRKAVMGKLANHLDDPFIPPGQMMDDHNSGKLFGPRGTGVIRFAAIPVVACEHDGFGKERRIGHRELSKDEWRGSRTRGLSRSSATGYKFVCIGFCPKASALPSHPLPIFPESARPRDRSMHKRDPRAGFFA